MKDWQGPVYLCITFSLAGSSVIAARLVCGHLGTFTIAAASLCFALILLLPFSWKTLIKTIRALSVKTLFYFFLQALFGIFLFRLFLLTGLLHTSTAEAGILTGATPAITAILALALLKEAINSQKTAGILCTVAGVLLIQGLLTLGDSFSLCHLTGNMLVLGAAACESSFSILSRLWAIKAANKQYQSIPPLVQTTIVAAIALLLCLIPALWEQPLAGLTDIGWREWLALTWYGVLTSWAYVFWYAGIKRCGAFAAAAFSGMMPFTALILSVAVLGEPAGWQQWCGGALVIGGMVLIGCGNNPLKEAAHIKRKNQERRREHAHIAK